MESRTQPLNEHAPCGIFRSTVEGVILAANPALAELLGYVSIHELMNVNLRALFRSPHEAAALLDCCDRNHTAPFRQAVTWVRKSGDEVLVHLSAHAVNNVDGSVDLVGAADDISQSHALDDQRYRTQKMNAIERVARAVAHDFNNVLAAILGTADLLMLRLASNEAARDDVEQIRKAAERGATLTRQLVTFGRNQVLDPTPSDLNVVASQSSGMLRQLAGDSVVVHLQTADAAALVRTEPARLEQVLVNLVSNARDAMPEGGTVHIEIEPIEIDERGPMRYANLPPGPYVRLSVHDTGTGIEPALQPHIFEPLLTTKRSPKWAGLGLSIVYGIARDAGGTVIFSTAVGKGTTFEVVLPRVNV